MEWLICIRAAIGYMEAHLRDDIGVQDVGRAVNVSPMFLQKGFSVMTGYGIGEYLRDRRLYQAAVDLCRTDDRVIDIALSYGYDTPESFTKAFTRFHGATPSQIRAGEAPVRSFLPLRINITIRGGTDMKYRVIEKEETTLIGSERRFSYEDVRRGIPAFWDEWTDGYGAVVSGKRAPENALERAVTANAIGEYGVCIDDDGGVRYLIAGRYGGGDVPEGMTLYTLPAGEWAVFECRGRLPEAIQKTDDAIYGEWLPGNPDYEPAGGVNVEQYDTNEDMNGECHAGVWIQVKRK